MGNVTTVDYMGLGLLICSLYSHKDIMNAKKIISSALTEEFIMTTEEYKQLAGSLSISSENVRKKRNDPEQPIISAAITIANGIDFFRRIHQTNYVTQDPDETEDLKKIKSVLNIQLERQYYDAPHLVARKRDELRELLLKPSIIKMVDNIIVDFRTHNEEC